MESGVRAWSKAECAEAEQHYKAALRHADNFGRRDPRLVTTIDNLAEVHRAQGRYTESEFLLRRALTICEAPLS